MAERFLEPNVPLKKIDNETGDTLYIYPQTTASQVKMDEDGTRLSTILTENIVYFEKENLDTSSEIIDADSLGGVPANEYVLESEFTELMGSAVSVDLNGASNFDQAEEINADLLGGEPAEFYKNSIAALSSEVSRKIPFSFGVDANGNYGYIKDGADTVTPFKQLSNLKKIYTYTQATAANGINTINIDPLNTEQALVVAWFQYTGTGSGSTGVHCAISSVTNATFSRVLGADTAARSTGITFDIGLLTKISDPITITLDHNQQNIHANIKLDIFTL